MKRIIVWLFFGIAFPTFVWWAYSSMWFEYYTEDASSTISFSCGNQCFLLLGEKGMHDGVFIDAIQGKGQIDVGTLTATSQFIPLDSQKVSGSWSYFIMLDESRWSTIPSNALVMVVLVGNFSGDRSIIKMSRQTWFDTFSKGFSNLLQYRKYDAQTINFLERPKRNDTYINQYFIRWIVGWLMLCALVYCFSRSHKSLSLSIGLGICIFFWMFFDLFATVNQLKIATHVLSADAIMDNGRLADMTDYYDFLEFVKSNTKAGSKTFFMMPYPFDAEGRYHNYPHNKIGTFTGSQYIIEYYPYKKKNFAWFSDPILANDILQWSWFSSKIAKIITWDKPPYGKIYIVDK